jgi:hypothetical protein
MIKKVIEREIELAKKDAIILELRYLRELEEIQTFVEQKQAMLDTIGDGSKIYYAG